MRSLIALVQCSAAHQRSLKTTKHNNSRHDESTIDFAYMPRENFFPDPTPREPRPPLLPDNFAPPVEHTNNAHHDFHIESVVKPTISTVSANGTHIDNPSAMSDVTDGHAQGVDMFDLTKKVSAATASKATELAGAATEEARSQQSSIAAFVNGVIDDIFGPKRTTNV